MAVDDRDDQRRVFDAAYGVVDLDETLMEVARGELHPTYNPTRRAAAAETAFRRLVDALPRGRVLTIGGGIDKVALYLAVRGHDVVALDISATATATTAALAAQLDIAARVSTMCCDFAAASFDAEFDAAITHDALHHLPIAPALARIAAALKRDGTFVAMEPVCRVRCVRWLHRVLPFHPYPITATEAELTPTDLALLHRRFGSVDLQDFDVLTRESLSWVLLHRMRCTRLHRSLQQLDRALLTLPFLRPLASYVVVRATQPLA